ncbi:hypothetical protein IEQ34_013559 [Dendrobium chrysotoxum]|uniref:Uncharacterized protein n=1 Tax=Dendrobium chrysotoxum TaxID=161865 RepID=A0AAV7GR78_DENCH|nr:hypothetical protein IEQ34_013559 [Dendrobium chrysotoxum]
MSIDDFYSLLYIEETNMATKNIAAANRQAPGPHLSSPLKKASRSREKLNMSWEYQAKAGGLKVKEKLSKRRRKQTSKRTRHHEISHVTNYKRHVDDMADECWKNIRLSLG